MSSNQAITTLFARNLTRHLGGHPVVRNVSLELRRGEVLGLLGHNGAGKSTTMQMLTGCLLPDVDTLDTCQIDICGASLLHDPVLAKSRIGYLPETPPLYREFSVDQYLNFTAKLRGVKHDDLSEALMLAKQRCGLESVGMKLIGTLSKGYQQRVGIAQAIIHSPDVIVLDEPTVGLDPKQLRDIRRLIRQLGDSHSVLLSTHLLGEVESICDRIEIMQNGRLIFGGTSETLHQQGEMHGFIVSLRNPPPLNEIRDISGINSIEVLSETRFRVLHEVDCNPAGDLIVLAARNGWHLEQLTPLQSTLEEAFVKVTEKDAAGGGQ